MKLGDLCEVVRGSSPRPKSDPRFYGGPVPRLMVSDLTRDGKVVSASTDSLTELGATKSRPMKKGDVVIAVSGAPGLPAILAHDACIHDGFVGLRDLDNRRVNGDFLFAYLMFVKATSISRAVGAIFKNLTTDQIRGIEIPDLPLSEQKRIAEILDQAQALRAKRRAALALLDELTQSIFLDMFGDPVSNSKGWDVRSLSTVLTFPLRNGLSPSKSGKVLANVLTLSAITGCAFNPFAVKESTFMSKPPANQSVSQSDFLICRGNGNVNLVGRGFFPKTSGQK